MSDREFVLMARYGEQIANEDSLEEEWGSIVSYCGLYGLNPQVFKVYVEILQSGVDCEEAARWFWAARNN